MWVLWRVNAKGPDGYNFSNNLKQKPYEKVFYYFIGCRWPDECHHGECSGAVWCPLDKEVLDASNRVGFFVGPTVKFTLPVVGLGIDASALYDQREAKVSVDGVQGVVDTEQTLKQRQIAIPINLRYGIGLGSTASIFLFAGPQFGFNVGDKEQSLWNEAAEWKLKTSNFSVNVGLGAMVLNHLQVTANYNIACGSTGDIRANSIVGNVLDLSKYATKGKNNSWQIGVAYFF